MSKGENMVERCARAMHDAAPGSKYVFGDDGKLSGREPLKWEDAPLSIRQLAFSRARAVIEALMEPTPEMLQAMHEAMFAEPYDATNDAMLGAGFVAALRTILSQPNDEE